MRGEGQRVIWYGGGMAGGSRPLVVGNTETVLGLALMERRDLRQERGVAWQTGYIFYLY